jgi:hypothetical protein
VCVLAELAFLEPIHKKNSSRHRCKKIIIPPAQQDGMCALGTENERERETVKTVDAPSRALVEVYPHPRIHPRPVLVHCPLGRDRKS